MVFVSEPVRGRSRATELPCFVSNSVIYTVLLSQLYASDSCTNVAVCKLEHPDLLRIVFDIDGMLLFMNFLNIERNTILRIFFFQYFIFSSRFMLFPT